MLLAWILAALLGAGQLEEARSLEERGEGRAALELVERVILSSPAWELPRLEAARLRLKLGEDLDLALAHVEAARSIAPENPRAHYLLGLVLEERGDARGALEAQELAVTYRADFQEARLRLAGLLFARGEWVLAEREYRVFLSLEPGSQAARLQLAAVLERQGRVADSEAELQRLYQEQPKSLLITRRLAEFLERTGRPDRAEEIRRATGESPKRQLRELPPSRR